jgi:hypothetical protein
LIKELQSLVLDVDLLEEKTYEKAKSGSEKRRLTAPGKKG